MTPEARHDDLLVQAVGDELVVYDQKRHRVHRLNRTAALVWRHCDGRTGAADMAALLQKECGLPADEEVVGLALARLAKARLLREERPEAIAPVTRRQVVRKLSLVGALVLLLPAVTSITAPTPAMAQSESLIEYCQRFTCPNMTNKECADQTHNQCTMCSGMNCLP